MARTAVTASDLVANGSLTDPAGTTIDAALVTAGIIISGEVLEELVLRVANTSGAARDVIVAAGDNPPALEAGQGAYTEEVPATSGVEWLGPFTSGRFVQTDGALHVDFEAGFTGTVTAFRVPRTA